MQKQMDMYSSLAGGLSQGIDSPKGVATGDAGGSNSNYQREAEVKFLKDLIMDEKGKREQGLQEHFKLFAQLQSTIAGIENEVLKKLKEHR